MASVQEQNSTSDKPEMVGDDSHLVDEILNELNDNSDNNDQQNDVQNTEQEIEQPKANLTDNMDYNNNFSELESEHKQTESLPPMVNIEYDSKENIGASMMNKIKKPLIVLLLCFIIFNPKIKEQLINLVPIFNTSNPLHMQLQTLILALVVSLLYFTTTLIC